MKFIIPNQLTPLDAINFGNYINNAHADKEYVYDFSKMQHCPPFGMLMVASSIRKNMNRFKNSKHRLDDSFFIQGEEYAAELGLFQSLGWEVGKKPELRDHGTNHIPIIRLTREDLLEKYSHETNVIGEMVENVAKEIAMILVRDPDSEVTKTLLYCIREMMRNTFEHARIGEIWICGQYWPTKNKAEIALLDEGCGIWSSLTNNYRFSVTNDKDANKLAMQPGVTRMMGMPQDPNDMWQNSGYGLYMASSICALGGHFWLCSGKDATLVNSEGQCNYGSSHQGTAICLSIQTDKIESLSRLLRELLNEGERIASLNDKNRVLTASKVSSIASIINEVKKNHPNE